MSVYKDTFTNTWACKFRYVDFDGASKQHKKTGFATKKEATDYETKKKDELKGSSADTFESVSRGYLEYCKATLKPTTYDDRERTFKRIFIPYFGKMKLQNITKPVVRDWQMSIINNEEYKPSTQRKLHVYLSAFFQYAVELGYIENKPMPKPIGNSKSNHIDFWTTEEFNIFIKSESSPIYRVAFSLLFYTGMRIGELKALTYKDFNFEKSTVSINKNYHKIKNEVYITTPKTPKSNRTISIPKELMMMVGKYFISCYGMKEDNILFPLAVNSFRSELRRVADSQGLRQIRIHDLRHSHASMLMDIGTPIKLISERLGHENIQTTLDIYSHLYEDKEKELAEKLNNIFKVKIV